MRITFVVVTTLALFLGLYMFINTEGKYNYFIDQCRQAVKDPDEDRIATLYCFGMLKKVYAANLFLQWMKSDKAFCVPVPFVEYDLAKAFIEVLDNNPDIPNTWDATIAHEALHVAYPCNYE